MCHNKELIDWAKAYYETLKQQLAVLHYKEEYYLSSDEGGMLGNPRFKISNFKEDRPHFRQIGKLYRDDIEKYILGRIITWKLLNEDYSQKTTIIISV